MNLIFLRQITESELPTLLQVLSGRASGGFPSPAADHYEAPISLDDLVDLRAPQVWLGETEGYSMSSAGTCRGLLSRESFADLTGIAEPLEDFARQIQARVRSWTGMPVGISIGHTKTLAKAAQHASKLYKERPGGAVDLRADLAVEWLLKRIPTQETWGVGRRISMTLGADGVTTAWQPPDTDPKTIRQRYGVVLERTGEPCMSSRKRSLTDTPSARPEYLVSV
ncbi:MULTISPECIES: Y-family DNA polymerase [unclassified Pseudomonas]|uniref:Y-family DNA polymerase n=1 Tax=unclassified Pseudomonas TaxID=196821 RepID=UPI001FD36A61|nr:MULTISPECIES: hypothetical protein [unclassified Pseudomonas]